MRIVMVMMVMMVMMMMVMMMMVMVAMMMVVMMVMMTTSVRCLDYTVRLASDVCSSNSLSILQLAFNTRFS